MREESVLEDDAVEVVNRIEDGADDGDGIVFDKLALCKDAVKKLSAGGELLQRYRQGNECARMNLNNQQDDT